MIGNAYGLWPTLEGFRVALLKFHRGLFLLHRLRGRRRFQKAEDCSGSVSGRGLARAMVHGVSTVTATARGCRRVGPGGDDLLQRQVREQACHLSLQFTCVQRPQDMGRANTFV